MDGPYSSGPSTGAAFQPLSMHSWSATTSGPPRWHSTSSSRAVSRERDRHRRPRARDGASTKSAPSRASTCSRSCWSAARFCRGACPLPRWLCPTEGRATFVIATLEGDVHDLGKNIAHGARRKGLRVVDLGRDCPVGDLVSAAQHEGAAAVLVSGLISPVVSQVRKLRPSAARLRSRARPSRGRRCCTEAVAPGGARRRLRRRECLRRGALSRASCAQDARVMNSLERILRATRLEPVDRTPLVPQLFGHAAITAGLSLRHYLHDGEALAHAQVLERERYRTDAVFAFLDFGVEAEALGAPLSFRADRYPDVVGCVPRRRRSLRSATRSRGRRSHAGLPAGAARDAAAARGRRPRRGGGGRADDHQCAALRHRERTVSRNRRLAASCCCTRFRHPAGHRLWARPTRRRCARGDRVRAGGVAGSRPARVLPRIRRPAPRARPGGCATVKVAFTWLNIAGPTAGILDAYARIGADVATFDYYLSAAEGVPPVAANLPRRKPEVARFPRRCTGRGRAPGSRTGRGLRGAQRLPALGRCEIPPEAAAESIAAMAAALSVE